MKKKLLKEIKKIKIAQIYQEKILQNKKVQNVSKKAALPAIAVLATSNVLATTATSAISLWAILQYLLQLLKYLFTQPLLLLSRKRKEWGTVYDSKTKEPIGLAIIRLYQIVKNPISGNEEKKLIQTKVTGPDGRYIFYLKESGIYQIQVIHSDYIFPSKILSGKETDGVYLDLYTGNRFEIKNEEKEKRTEKKVINFNIPLDLKEGRINLVGSSKRIKIKPRKIDDYLNLPKSEREREFKLILKQARQRKFATSFAFISPILALINLIVSPGILTIIFLLFNIFLFFLFKKLALKIKPKPWGKTFEKISGKALPNTLIRLFDCQFGKQIACQFTDNSGRYGFLVGPEEYYLTAEKPNYILPEEKITIKGEKERIVKRDLGMIRKHWHQYLSFLAS